MHVVNLEVRFTPREDDVLSPYLLVDSPPHLLGAAGHRTKHFPSLLCPTVPLISLHVLPEMDLVQPGEQVQLSK